jgi:hypothetical protein
MTFLADPPASGKVPRLLAVTLMEKLHLLRRTSEASEFCLKRLMPTPYFTGECRFVSTHCLTKLTFSPKSSIAHQLGLLSRKAVSLQAMGSCLIVSWHSLFQVDAGRAILASSETINTHSSVYEPSNVCSVYKVSVSTARQCNSCLITAVSCMGAPKSNSSSSTAGNSAGKDLEPFAPSTPTPQKRRGGLFRTPPNTTLAVESTTVTKGKRKRKREGCRSPCTF